MEYDFDTPLDAPLPPTVFPEGLVSFTVVAFQRVRKPVKWKGAAIENGKPIAVAELKLECVNVENGQEDTLDVDLPLEERFMFKLWQFFTAIGQRKHGEDKQFLPRWKEVMGSTGFALVKHSPSKNKRDDGSDYPPYVNIDKFFTKEEAEKHQAEPPKAASKTKSYFD